MPFKVPTPQSQASGEKRSVDGTSSSQQTKKPKTLPPLTDMVAMESAPKKGNAQRLPAVSPLNICVYKARQLSLFLSLSLSLSLSLVVVACLIALRLSVCCLRYN